MPLFSFRKMKLIIIKILILASLVSVICGCTTVQHITNGFFEGNRKQRREKVLSDYYRDQGYSSQEAGNRAFEDRFAEDMK